MENTKLSNLYSYKKLLKYNGLLGNTKVVSRRIKFGIELEIENINSYFVFVSPFNLVTDHSLKIGGGELVSVPLDLQFIEVELQRAKGNLIATQISFSKRTSVHAHMNVRDFTSLELYKFILLYLIFEKALFKYSGSRDNNPFCIPLYHLEDKVSIALDKIKTGQIKEVHWNKYRALNLCPIWGSESEGSKRYGTVEFRHMVGNLDIPYIINWLNLIACLKIAAKKLDLEELLSHIRTMNTTSGYGWLTKEVFGYWSKFLVNLPDYTQDLEDGIAFTKLVLASQPKTTSLSFIIDTIDAITPEESDFNF